MPATITPARRALALAALVLPYLAAADGCSVNAPEAECINREHAEGDKTWQEAREACPIPE
jgi:hypothetical protein